MNKKELSELKESVIEIVEHGNASAIVPGVMDIIEALPSGKTISLNYNDAKKRGILASVALKAAVELLPHINDKSELELADLLYVWLRVKEEVGMPKEVLEGVQKVSPF